MAILEALVTQEPQECPREAAEALGAMEDTVYLHFLCVKTKVHHLEGRGQKALALIGQGAQVEAVERQELMELVVPVAEAAVAEEETQRLETPPTLEALEALEVQVIQGVSL